jgi:hypothetical protein
VFAHRSPPQYETSRSAAARANVSAGYAEDIAFFAEDNRFREEWFGRKRPGRPDLIEQLENA